jgi:hypothetical protein
MQLMMHLLEACDCTVGAATHIGLCGFWVAVAEVCSGLQGLLDLSRH